MAIVTTPSEHEEPEEMPANHAGHVAWLRRQYAFTPEEAEAEARRRYEAYPDERARWNGEPTAARARGYFAREYGSARRAAALRNGEA